MTRAKTGPGTGHRVVHIIAPSRFGGAETVVRSLAQAQMAEGLDVVVMVVMDARDGSDHPFLAAARGDGLTVECVHVPARGYRYERKAVAEHLLAIAPSVLHSHSQRTDVLHGDVVRRLGIPAVSTVHGFTGGSLRNKLYERLQRFSLRRFDGVIAVSEPLGAELLRAGLRGDRLSVIANAFVLPTTSLDRAGARHALGLPEEQLIGAWIGRLSLEKGPDVLVESLADPTFPRELTVLVIGDGPERARLERLSVELGLGARLRFCGPREEVARLFPAFDVLIQSSRTEGTPMVLLEAMAANVPIVATRVGGIPNLLNDLQARLVPSESPSLIAQAVADVIHDRHAAAERASAARDHLSRAFAIRPWVDRHVELYDRAVAHRRLSNR
jgi:glycosyltransferase involved in cell wall biosynthesis